MIDVQNQPDERQWPIDHVGVRDLRYPIVVLDRAHGRQQTIARISVSVSLPHHFKGTHMSRFLEVLHEHHGEMMTIRTLPAILERLKERLEAERARLEVRFLYFLEKEVSVSRARSLMDYECYFAGELAGGAAEFALGVVVPVTSVCPCSKAISDYGAHNQRGFLTIEVTGGGTGPDDFIWIEEVVAIGEKAGSAPIYPLLKRADERHVTMQAYDNPVFVEDMVRSVAVALEADRRVRKFRVLAENDESIHTHKAFAEIRWTRA